MVCDDKAVNFKNDMGAQANAIFFKKNDKKTLQVEPLQCLNARYERTLGKDGKCLVNSFRIASIYNKGSSIEIPAIRF